MECPNEDLGGCDEANYTAFLLGTPSLQAAGCSTEPILKVPRAWVVLCILHLTMAMGRLLGEFLDREARLVTPALRRDLQVLLSERRAGWSVYGSASPDGEETSNFFDAWPDIAKCLGIRPSTAKYKAIANMWDLLQALYCTYQGPNPLNCAAVARDFRRHCTAGTASWYLLSLGQDVETMLQNIKPFGLAMFCGDISESINRFLKHGHNEHTNRGGGGCRVEGVDEVSGRKLSAIHREANVQAQCMTWLLAYFDVSWVVHGGPRSQVPCSGRDAMELRRHKLPIPHLALWPTEVRVVMRGKVCEKGCYFLGIQTPLVATCKNNVCISNICHYLHFWKHTGFQNKDIQSPKYSVVLHLDHCIPVWGGEGAAYFSLPFVPA